MSVMRCKLAEKEDETMVVWQKIDELIKEFNDKLYSNGNYYYLCKPIIFFQI